MEEDQFNDLVDMTLDLHGVVSRQADQLDILRREALSTEITVLDHQERIEELTQEIRNLKNKPMKLKDKLWYIIAMGMALSILLHLLINFDSLDNIWHGIIVLLIVVGFMVGNIVMYFKEKENKDDK